MNTELFEQIPSSPELAAEIYANEYNNYVKSMEVLSGMRERFHATGKIAPTVRPEIAKSWQRCRDRGLSSEQDGLVNVEEKEVDAALRQNAYLIRIAEPVMRSVQENLTRVSCLCATYLTDSKGIILDIVYSKEIGKSIESLGMRPGVLWNEERIGTNAISLAIEYDKLFYTNAPEHYLNDHTFVNCVTAPIHSNEGDIIGTITVTFYKDFYNEFLLALLSTAASLIEKQFLNLRNTAIIDYTLNDASDGVLILNSRLRILHVNKRFQQLINEPQPKPETLDIAMLFKDVDFAALQKEIELHVSIGETFLSYKSIYTRVSVDIYRIENYGAIDGYVIICRDVADIIALSQQFTGSATTFHFDSIITNNAEMLSLIAQCRQIANQKIPILLEGESGTGKEVFAQSIHNASSRSNKPFVAVNCAALPISLVESELFGYEKGSFTDGLATGKAGKFELANGGTIFLDEIGELPLDVQAKLLRVLDNYRVTRIGGKAEKKLDIRLIAATNRDLFTMVQARTFREDLYYRINVMNFRLPPLSERRDDIPLLIRYFIDRLNMENRGIAKEMDADCMRLLCGHIWKGNVRELQNAVTRAYYLCNAKMITKSCLTHDIRETAPALTVLSEQTHPKTRAEMEAGLMREALVACGSNVAEAAESVGMSRATFYRKMKKYQLYA